MTNEPTQNPEPPIRSLTRALADPRLFVDGDLSSAWLRARSDDELKILAFTAGLHLEPDMLSAAARELNRRRDAVKKGKPKL